MSKIWLTFSSTRHGLFGASFLRVGISLVMLGIYLVNFKSRFLLWGGDGLVPYTTYIDQPFTSIFDLYWYNGSAWYTESLYWFGALTALAFAVGFQCRKVCWLFAITTFATIHRVPLAFDGGAVLLRVTAIYLCFMETDRYLTLFPKTRSFYNPASTWHVVETMLHNAARFVTSFQIFTVYFWASFYKLCGPMWRDGTALHYISQLERYHAFSGVSITIANDKFLMAATYATLVFQATFPVLMWWRPLKLWLIIVATVLHIGIAVTMGLISFTVTTIIIDLSLVPDSEWLRAYFFIRRLWLKPFNFKSWLGRSDGTFVDRPQ